MLLWWALPAVFTRAEQMQTPHFVSLKTELNTLCKFEFCSGDLKMTNTCVLQCWFNINMFDNSIQVGGKTCNRKSGVLQEGSYEEQGKTNWATGNERTCWVWKAGMCHMEMVKDTLRKCMLLPMSHRQTVSNSRERTKVTLSSASPVPTWPAPAPEALPQAHCPWGATVPMCSCKDQFYPTMAAAISYLGGFSGPSTESTVPSRRLSTPFSVALGYPEFWLCCSFL